MFTAVVLLLLPKPLLARLQPLMGRGWTGEGEGRRGRREAGKNWIPGAGAASWKCRPFPGSEWPSQKLARSSPNSGKISRFEFSVIVKRAKKKKMADASVLYFILRNGFDFIESVLRCRGILDDPGLFSAILGYFRLFSFILVYYGGKCGRSEVMAHC